MPKVQRQSSTTAGIRFRQITSAHVTAITLYVTLPRLRLDVNMSTSTGFFKYACLKGLIMVMQQVTL